MVLSYWNFSNSQADGRRQLFPFFLSLTALVICPEENAFPPCWFWGDGIVFSQWEFFFPFRARKWLNTIWRSWSPKGSHSSPAGRLPQCADRRMSKPRLSDMTLMMFCWSLGLVELPKSKLAAPAPQQKLSALMVCTVQAGAAAGNRNALSSTD